MRLRRTAAAAFFTAYLVVQLGVPTIQLFAERPARLGWHMYSALPSLPDAWAVAADGSAARVDVRGRLAKPRAEVNYTAVLHTALCREEAVTAVRVAYPGRDPEVLACR